MPQFDMILLTPAQVQGAEVLEHTAGSPAREGGGDETYRCGSCKTKLLVNVAHHDAGTNVGADGAGAGALIVESLPIVWASAVRGALQRLHSVRHWKLWLPQLAQSQSPGTYAAAPPATGPDGAAEITRFPPGGAAAPGGKARGVKAGAAPAL